MVANGRFRGVRPSAWGAEMNAPFQKVESIESKKVWTSPKVANAFLEWLRPGGPWVLTAIVPDGSITTETVDDAAGVEAFITRHNSRAGIYYTPNRCRRRMTSKPRKTDIDQIEFAWCDADPRADETPSQAKQRYQAALEKAGLQAAMVDSGNGLQAIFKL